MLSISLNLKPQIQIFKKVFEGGKNQQSIICSSSNLVLFFLSVAFVSSTHKRVSSQHVAI
jgi:hypothetical protein